MKKTYETPKITVLGTVEEITQAFGSSSAIDTIYYGNYGWSATGSQDGEVVPKR